MIDIFHYILKVNSIFIILYLVYFFLFRRLTFHQLNRIFLLLILPVSLIVPKLGIGISQAGMLPQTFPPLIEQVESFGQSSAQIDVPNVEWNTAVFLGVFYVLIAFVFVFKRIRNILKLYTIKRGAGSYTMGKFTFIEANVPSVFSFFTWIFVPKRSEQPKNIIEHEKAHARFYHTCDLLLTELYIALFWFNPFVYLYRRDIKTIHEFQVDNYMLRLKINAPDYLRLMLSGLENQTLRNVMCNNFYGSGLEQRIKMISGDKSAKWSCTRYLFLIPVLAFVLMAFSVNTNKGSNIPDQFPIQNKEKYKISSEYGLRIHPLTKENKFHYGIDFSSSIGTPVIATANGTVIRTEYIESGYGKLIEIDHKNGFVTRFAQLSKYAVKPGEEVRQGDIIGCVGNTGRSTGPHLHYEVIKDGTHVNPLDLIKK